MSFLPLRAPVRVHPVAGLVIDVDTWATAHDYHRIHQQLHLLSLHGSGIANGLEVVPTDPPSDTVVVEPGIAIDANGNVIVVPERQHLTLGEGGGISHIVLDYVESIPPASADSRDTRSRVLEDYRLRVLQALPESSAIELARVQLSEAEALISCAPNPWAPAFNEIDPRYRPRLQSRAARDLAVCFLLHGAEEDISPEHRTGFQYLLRELEKSGLRASVVKAIDGSVPPADFLYVTASARSTLPAQLVRRLADRVSEGTWLFADPCGIGTEMVQSLKSIVKNKEAAGRTETLVLGSHHVFGTAPPGAFPTREILWGENTVISPRDYGCAWAGRCGDQVFQRDLIRSALEFGVNVGFSVLGDVAAR